MKLSTLAAALATTALAFACTAQPEPPEAQRIEAVQPLPFSQHVQMKAVDAGSTYMKRLVEHVAVRRDETPDAVRSEHEEWVIDRGTPPTTDFFLTASSRDVLARYVSATPSLTVPPGREIAFGQLDGSDRWRTYLLDTHVELDGSDVAHAELRRDAESDRATVTLDFTAAGARRFHDATAHLVGRKLAVLVDGSVVAAPVIKDAISGGRAELTFAR